MKKLSIAVLSVCATLCSLCSFAQNQKIPLNEPDYNKSKLFNDLPDRINFNPSNLANLFQVKVGQVVTVPLTPDFSFNGQVVSTSMGENASSVVIKSANRLGASFTFTRVTDANQNVKYIGRIISLQHGDTYDVVVENSQYYLKKKGLYDLVNE